MQWSPILSSEDKIAANVEEAVEAIARSLIARDYGLRGNEARRHCACEEALLYGYLALARNDPEWATRAIERLNQGIDEAPEQSGYLGLFGGLVGLGWTVEHLTQLLSHTSSLGESGLSAGAEIEAIEIEEDANAEIDAVVLRALRHFNSSRPYDLISGLVGFGVYFLERYPRETAIQGIQAIFDQIERLAEHTSNGTTWHSGPDLLPEWQRALCPRGYYNLGVAHGIPGIIHFLNEVSDLSIVDHKRSHRLLEGAVNWLIANRLPTGSRSIFSPWIAPGESPTDSRMAWCYGDAGILPILLQVARCSRRDDWRKFANDLLDHCLAWPPQEGGVADAPLCHGAAGMVHIFNRIYQSENDPRCLSAALTWLDRVLAMRKPGTGIGGFSSLTKPVPGGPTVWDANPAFLDGAIGVALTLLAAITSVAPAWDRMLLLSGRE